MSEVFMDRYWINQPSTIQTHHALHGQLVLAPRNLGFGSVTIYFTKGDVISMRADCRILSPGWPKHLQDKEQA